MIDRYLTKAQAEQARRRDLWRVPLAKLPELTHMKPKAVAPPAPVSTPALSPLVCEPTPEPAVVQIQHVGLETPAPSRVRSSRTSKTSASKRAGKKPAKKAIKRKKGK